MAVAERQTTRVSLFGRVADDVTRRTLNAGEMSVALDSGAQTAQAALCKDDGHFALVNLDPAPAGYRIRLGGPAYQDRVVTMPLPAAAPVRVTFAGEDELYVRIGTVTATQNRVAFETIGFVPTIAAGAQVIGESAFTATLAEPIEGLNLQSAVLSAVGPLAPNQLLRIVRSPNLLLWPSPYYPFPAGTTVVAVHVAGNDPAATPVAGVTVSIAKMNGVAGTLTNVGTLPLTTFALGGPASFMVLDDRHLSTTTNDRGDAVFYFPGEKAVTAVDVNLSKPQYQPATAAITVTAAQRTFRSVVLNRV